jgi:hypothetical protein
VFGCLCYPNTSSTRPHKLAHRSVPCVFLGYPANYRGYRCLDISTGKTIFSRHVTFDEAQFPFLNPSKPSPNHSFLDPSPLIFTQPTPSTTPLPTHGPTTTPPNCPTSTNNNLPHPTEPSILGPPPIPTGLTAPCMTPTFAQPAPHTTPHMASSSTTQPHHVYPLHADPVQIGHLQTPPTGVT